MKKKQYFRELEEEMDGLKEQLEIKDAKIAELNHKIISYEINHTSSPDDLKGYKDTLIQNWLALVENMPEDEFMLEKQEELNEKFSAFGSERLNTLDSSFKSILENLCPDTFTLVFKYLSKPAVTPATPEYEQYKTVLSKFTAGEVKILKNLKNSFKTGITTLFKSRSDLLKSMAILGEMEKSAKSCVLRKSKSGIKEKISQLAQTHTLTDEIWDIQRKVVDSKIKIGKKAKTVGIEEVFISDVASE